MALILSILALFGTFYQAYLQRVHNQKSVKPLIQIDFVDHKDSIGVRVYNNGIGPFIVTGITYQQGDQCYDNIENCLPTDAKSYQHISPLGVLTKTIAPGEFLTVFSKRIDNETSTIADETRQQLSVLTLKVVGVDIYDNKIFVERDLNWFIRHQNNRNS